MTFVTYFLYCWLIHEILLKLRLYFTLVFKGKQLLLAGTAVYAAVMGHTAALLIIFYFCCMTIKCKVQKES